MRRSRVAPLLAGILSLGLLVGAPSVAFADDPPPTYTISGTVSGGPDSPLVGVWISGSSFGPGGSAFLPSIETDANGHYAFDGVEAGTYSMSLSGSTVDPYIVPYLSVTVGPSNPAAIQDFLLELKPTGTGSLTGVVTDSVSHALLEGIQVSLTVQVGSYSHYENVTTGSDGRYAFAAIPPGTRATLTFTDIGGHTYFSKSLQVILIPESLNTRNTTLVLKPIGTGSISGTATMGGGAALELASVYLYRPGSYFSYVDYASLSDASGTAAYEFSGLTDGLYELSFNANNAPQRTVTVSVSGGGATSVAPVTFTPYPVGTGSISGTVTDSATGERVEGARVSAYPTSGIGGYIPSVETASNGTFTIPDLADGSYGVSVVPSDAVPPAGRLGFDLEAWEGADAVAQVTGGGATTGVALIVKSFGPGTSVLQGRVRDSTTYLPVPGLTVSISGFGAGLTLDDVMTDSTGRFEVGSLPEGVYSIRVTGEGYADASTRITIQGATTAVVIPINAASGGVGDGLDGSIEVTVVDGLGHPLDSASVQLAAQSGQLPEYDYSGVDETGTRTFTGLSAGEWLVTASGTAADGTPLVFTSQTVDLDEADPEASVTLTAVAPSVIAGQVELDGVDPVYLHAVVTDENGNLQGLADIEDDGSFSVPNLPSGDLYLSLWGGFGVYGGPIEGTTPLPDTWSTRVWWAEEDGDQTQVLDLDDATAIPLSPASIEDGFELTAVLGASVRAEVELESPSGTASLPSSRCFDLVAYREVGSTFVRDDDAWDFACGDEPLVSRGLRPGRYKFAIADEQTGSTAFTTKFHGGSSLSSSTIVTVDGDDTVDLGTIVVSVPAPSAGTLAAIDLDYLLSHGVDVGDYEDQITVGGDLEEGEDTQVEVGSDLAGQWVNVSLNSIPTVVGSAWHQVAADGTVTVTLPDGISGDHRLAVADSSGQLVGWTAVEIAEGAATGGPTGGGSTPGSAGPATSAKPAAKPSGGTTAPIIESTPTASPTATPVAVDEPEAAPADTPEPTAADASTDDTGWIVWLVVGGLVVLVGAAAVLIVRRRLA